MHIVIMPPAEEALTPADIQAQVRAYADEVAAQAAYYTRLIVAARQAAEGELLRPVLPQTCRVRVDAFDRRIRLWHDVTQIVSVNYVDQDGSSQTLDPARYRIADGADLVAVGQWPRGTDVQIEFTAGFWLTPDDVPECIKVWMLLHIGGLDANRGVMGSVQTFALPAGITNMYLQPYAKQVI